MRWSPIWRRKLVTEMWVQVEQALHELRASNPDCLVQQVQPVRIVHLQQAPCRDLIQKREQGKGRGREDCFESLLTPIRPHLLFLLLGQQSLALQPLSLQQRTNSVQDLSLALSSPSLQQSFNVEGLGWLGLRLVLIPFLLGLVTCHRRFVWLVVWLELWVCIALGWQK